jgi:hypothetical protein
MNQSRLEIAHLEAELEQRTSSLPGEDETAMWSAGGWCQRNQAAVDFSLVDSLLALNLATANSEVSHELISTRKRFDFSWGEL